MGMNGSTGMKTDRLIGILSVLLQKKAVTAPDLAERFEVSRRTINRDIAALCRAGIPIVTKQGKDGGISIMEEYKLDRTLLTCEEMEDILAGLRRLCSVNDTKRYERLMEKLSAGASDFLRGNPSVLIDLSSWDKDLLAPKIDLIRRAIDQTRQLAFCYYGSKGEGDRRIEPYYLIFRWSDWYVWGWCVERKDFRLFKLHRMDELRLAETVFEKRPVPLPDLSNERIFTGGIRIKAAFNAGCKWRLVEEFGADCFEEGEDGRLLFVREYTDQENLLTWLLSFRDQVELLEPQELREKLCGALRAAVKIYEKGNQEYET